MKRPGAVASRRAALAGVSAWLALLVLLVVEHATAHTLGLTDTALDVARPGVRIVQTLPLAELDSGGRPAAEVSSREWLARVADGWRVSADAWACELAASSVRPLDALDALQFDLRFHCATLPATLTIEYPLAADFKPSHVNLARVLIGRPLLPFRFTRSRSLLRLPLQTLTSRGGVDLPSAFRADDPNATLGEEAVSDVAPSVEPPAAVAQDGGEAAPPAGRALITAAAIYLPSGVEHILQGPDHLAFVLALVLIPLTLRRLALAVTLFTLAHSVTLGLAYFQVFSLAPTLTEPLIALSVAAVGVENLLARHRAGVLRLREMTVFCFGLVHGVGLSYQLGELPAQSSLEAATRLLMFNVGVELGQLAVLVFPGLGLVWAVNQRFGRTVTTLGSAVLIALGGFWFVARVAGG